jgi:hypothetical protein
MTEEAWQILWGLVDYLREHERPLYSMYLYERTIANHIVDRFASDELEDDLAAVVADLRHAATTEADWLIAVPLVNAVAPAETVELDERSMLVQTDNERDWTRFGSHLSDVWAIERHLKDELTVRQRWLSAHGPREVDIDTRVASVLLLQEAGTEELAASTALTKARLAVAVWTLLDPPTWTPEGRPVWPTVGNWAPSPYLEFGLQQKPYEPWEPSSGQLRQRRLGVRRGQWLYEHGMYEITDDPEVLGAPSNAIRRALTANHCATALLTAARSLYLAGRVPTELERTERVLNAWIAKEALCDPGGPNRGRGRDRWEWLVETLDLRAQLASRGYRTSDIDTAFDFAEDLRDLASHRAEATLVNLGFPPGLATRTLDQRVLTQNELALANVTADWPVGVGHGGDENRGNGSTRLLARNGDEGEDVGSRSRRPALSRLAQYGSTIAVAGPVRPLVSLAHRVDATATSRRHPALGSPPCPKSLVRFPRARTPLPERDPTPTAAPAPPERRAPAGGAVRVGSDLGAALAAAGVR